MGIKVQLRHRLPSFALDVDFESHGRFTALFGASGSGKTTVVNAIAGLLRPDEAVIEVDGKSLADTGRGIDLPPHKRRIGYVFQDARLFPHLSVAGNLGYGSWFAPKAGRIAGRDQVLDLLGIGHLLPRSPRDLSGGERQRVAIGRALLSSPQLLLMDEPLSSLDPMRKAEILPYLERLRDEAGIPVIYVSHSVAEAMRLATDIVVMAEGRSIAHGPAASIAARLDLLPPEEQDEGGVILDMRVAAHDPQFDMTRLESEAGSVFAQGAIGEAGRPVRVRIRARDVMIATSPPQNISALNVLRGTVGAVDPAGPSSVTVSLDCHGSAVLARITRQSAAGLGLAPGMTAYAIVKSVSVTAPTAAPL